MCHVGESCAKRLFFPEKMTYCRLCFSVESGLGLLDVLVIDILVVFHELVDGSVGSQFDDAVGHGLDEFVVVAGKEDVALEVHQVVVEGLDAFQVE